LKKISRKINGDAGNESLEELDSEEQEVYNRALMYDFGHAS